MDSDAVRLAKKQMLVAAVLEEVILDDAIDAAIDAVGAMAHE